MPKKIYSPFSNYLANPLMPSTGWETNARLERLRKYLYKYNDELHYIFPQNDDEQLIIDKSRELVSTMINILSDVLQKKKNKK